jgi:DNA-binding MarR family transcriptional regulator
MPRDRNDPLHRSPIHLLHRAGQSAEQIFDGQIAGNLTPRQLAVLTAVAQNKGVSQTGIVDATGIDRSTLADIVRRLVKRKLLQRRRTRHDARAYAVTLTEEGWRLLRAAEPLAKRIDQRVLDALPAGHREQFIASLLAIVNALQGLAPQGKQRAA